MELAFIILKQTIIMALYMSAGFILYKTKCISDEGSKSLAAILVRLVIPAMLINSIAVPYSTEKLIQLGWCMLLGALGLLISILVSGILFGKYPIDNFSASYANVGFIGIPLVQASLGDEAVFFILGYILLLNLLQCTHGIKILCGKGGKMNLKNTLLNPIMIAAVLSLLVFASGIGDKLPSVISTTLSGISALNAPLAMLVLGVYLAQVDFKSLFTTPRLYLLCGVRLLLIPLLTIIAFHFIPIGTDMKLAVAVVASTPVGANVAIYAQMFGSDYHYACKAVTLSTIFSIVTLPLLAAVAQLLI